MSLTPIIIDAGHGGADSGAVSHDGSLKEKDVVLDVSKRVYALLKPHTTCTVTRSSDLFLTLSQRASLANARGAALLSIHCNSGGGTGFECFTSPGQTSSDTWATACLEKYHQTFPELAYRKDSSDGDPDKEARFTVLTSSQGPAILFELGFIDQKDLDFLKSVSNRQKMAEALAQATMEHFGVTYQVNHQTDDPQIADGQEDGAAIISAIEVKLAKLKELIA